MSKYQQLQIVKPTTKKPYLSLKNPNLPDCYTVSSSSDSGSEKAIHVMISSSSSSSLSDSEDETTSSSDSSSTCSSDNEEQSSPSLLFKRSESDILEYAINASGVVENESNNAFGPVTVKELTEEDQSTNMVQKLLACVNDTKTVSTEEIKYNFSTQSQNPIASTSASREVNLTKPVASKEHNNIKTIDSAPKQENVGVSTNNNKRGGTNTATGGNKRRKKVPGEVVSRGRPKGSKNKTPAQKKEMMNNKKMQSPPSPKIVNASTIKQSKTPPAAAASRSDPGSGSRTVSRTVSRSVSRSDGQTIARTHARDTPPAQPPAVKQVLLEKREVPLHRPQPIQQQAPPPSHGFYQPYQFQSQQQQHQCPPPPSSSSTFQPIAAMNTSAAMSAHNMCAAAQALLYMNYLQQQQPPTQVVSGSAHAPVPAHAPSMLQPSTGFIPNNFETFKIANANLQNLYYSQSQPFNATNRF